MAQLGAKSVILTTYENTLKTELFDDVFVVTDSEIIFKEITGNGGKAIMSLTEHQTGSDRIAEAVENLECDIVVNVQGDEPFVKKEALQKLVDAYQNDLNDEISLATLAQEITEEEDIYNPNSVKVNWDVNLFALYFSRSPIPYPRDETVQVKYHKHKGVYAFRKEALLDFYRLPMLKLEASEKIECIRYLEYGKKIKMVETDVQGVEIDTPEDLERAKKLWK